MRQRTLILGIVIMLAGCTSTEKMTFLNNLPETPEAQYFPMDIPDYKIQYRDILYITVKSLTPEGSIEDMLIGKSGNNQANYIRDESSQFIIGYTVDIDGNISLPEIGKIKVSGFTIQEINSIVQEEVSKTFKNSFADCKLLSYKYTVLGEVRIPGTYVNYNNYLTVLEAIGRAGGIDDFGNRNRVLIVRPVDNGTQTYRINLQDKSLLLSEAYFLQPNDVVIVEPMKHKIFNLNLPTYTFLLTSITSAITTTLLLINFLNTD